MDAWRRHWIINIIFIKLILELFGTILSVIFEMVLNLETILLIIILGIAIAFITTSWIYLVRLVESGKTLRALLFVLAIQPIFYALLLWLQRTDMAFVSTAYFWFIMWTVTTIITIYFLNKVWRQQR